MLFNSQVFILLFLPLTLFGYYIFNKNDDVRIVFLIIVSLVFYGYWDYRFVPFLVSSVLANYLIARLYEKFEKTWLITLGVSVNLLLIGVFKYANFFAENVSFFLVVQNEAWDIVLPLGISFFTFQQISFLLDLKKKPEIVYPLHKYALYVTFFPQLVAGPIVRHNEIIYQFDKSPKRPGLYKRLSQGGMLFILGLTKKAVIADGLAETATPLFSKAGMSAVLTFGESWLAALTYTLQLYFDFSGYSDMAIGLGLLFGFSLPVNFNAPYVSKSIREFWRRWHISLSRFLRDYLYIPMNGDGHGLHRQMVALLVTMFLGGLWHGAGWSFIVWGGMHGIAIGVNHLWRRTGMELPSAVSWFMTTLFVVFCWVIFRAENIPTAFCIIQAMIGYSEWSFASSVKVDDVLFIVAGLLALFGPTTQSLILEKLSPKPIIALAFSLLLISLLLKVGNHGYTEFIYFQF